MTWFNFSSVNLLHWFDHRAAQVKEKGRCQELLKERVVSGSRVKVVEVARNGHAEYVLKDRARTICWLVEWAVGEEERFWSWATGRMKLVLLILLHLITSFSKLSTIHFPEVIKTQPQPTIGLTCFLSDRAIPRVCLQTGPAQLPSIWAWACDAEEVPLRGNLFEELRLSPREKRLWVTRSWQKILRNRRKGISGISVSAPRFLPSPDLHRLLFGSQRVREGND